MLTYNLNNRGDIPIYEYLYRCIRDDIRSGRLATGTKLPSKRELAADNGVALITVENAYAQLIVEGYVEARQRYGYFVEDVSQIESVDQIESIRQREGIRQIESVDQTESIRQTESICNVDGAGRNDLEMEAERNLVKTGSGASNPIDFSFPYSTWAKLMRRVLTDRERDFAVSPASEGVYELRKAIADYLYDSKNLRVNPDCIVVGPGTEYLHSIIIQLIGRNRLAAVEDPGYKKASQIYESNGMKVMHIPVDNEGIDVSKLEGSGIKLVHTSPAHHFPTGIVMSAARRHKLLNWARGQQAYIIEDDYDSEFRFKGLPLPTLMSLENEHVIYMNTFTGTLAASIRIAYMVLPDKLMAVYRDRLGFLSGTVSSFEQLTLAAFISEGYYERHISRMRNKYRKIRQKYREAFGQSELSKIAEIEEDPAGLNLIIVIKEQTKVIEDRKAGIPMTDYCYYKSANYSNKYIMRYRDIDEKQIRELFDSML